MKNNTIFYILFIFCLLACKQELPKLDQMHSHSHSRTDHHSYAQPDQAISKHLSLNLHANFKEKILSGEVIHTIQNNGASEIIFDVKNLVIESISIASKESENQLNYVKTDFTLGKSDDFLGQALHVKINENTTKVKIKYSTTDNASAVDWLDPIQTTDKQKPFLFTQGQAILTRTWIPCQDSPGIRVTYDAKLQVPSDLMAVMSAKNPQSRNENGEYNFIMEQAIPPYLIALAIGDLVFKPIGKRTGVYAEPSVIDKAVYEFADMEKMLIAAEELYGPYLWEQYDVIVLPASFPFGGMENPRLTFATPTILAGDRSLTALIAHELAHSWSGNLVTNATWDDFWLNEGFTVYFERRIMEALYGVDYVKMLTQLGIQDLNNQIKELGAESDDTHLKLSLKERDPDDGMTDIAYEKGCLFLMALEEEVGREKFDEFLKKYFSDHQFQTLTTEEFLEYLNRVLIQPEGVEIDIDAWVYSPGLPSLRPNVESNKFDLVEAFMGDKFKENNWTTKGTEAWSTHEWLHFIRSLPSDMDNTQASALDETYQFSKSGNSEIIAAWLEKSIYNGYYKNIESELENFLVNIGRRKFLTPLYKGLKNVGDLDLAKSIYTKARPNYHAVSSQTMDALLN